MTVQEGIEKIELLRLIHPVSRADIIPYTRIKLIHRGEHLFLDKDAVEDIFFILEGAVSLYKVNGNGEKRAIFVYGAGAMLDESVLDDKPASINAEALRDSQALAVNRTQFVQICARDFKLAKIVMDAMAMKIRRLYHLMQNTSHNIRSDKRIAARLWKLSRDHGVSCNQGIEINFDMTLTQLAELLGSQRETVSRQIKSLTEQGLVIFNKNRFIIPDREKLMHYFNDL